jgi:hypothetical protein
MRGKVPHRWLWPLIEWRAGRIGDEVEKLRFLQRVSRFSPPTPRLHLRRVTMSAVALIAAALASTSQLSNAVVYGKIRPAIRPAGAGRAAFPDVWLVEQRADYEIYSNGLRVERLLEVQGKPRHYGLIDRSAPDGGIRLWRSEPAGIVYHATESGVAPFAPSENQALKRMGASVLEYVRERQAYNYLIDRFGRVHRIVRDNAVANHAGYSVWADSRWLYLNLNASFLGVAFEARSGSGGEAHTLNPAQVHAGRILTEMLRARYGIPAANCVTHAQVSVNPSNMRVGYHTDWAGNLPFPELGLEDNYALAPPSISEFGFRYDPAFVKSTGARLWTGVALAEQELRQAAILAGLPVEEYRKRLERRYKKTLTALQAWSAGEERGDES